jgi:enoyl-CoA hydratase/carnithine racemase
MSDILIRVEGRAGRITLNRPKALNALTYDMLMAIETALDSWAGDDRVALVLIDAAGDKAFAAGGDIVDLYNSGRAGDFGFGRKFWADEYRVNAKIANYSKPYVALMHGFVMGGGVGVSCHGSHRVVDESAQVAMPECGIGLTPDVGGSLILGHAPGRCGEYLAMTSARMGPGDAIYAGFADTYVLCARWEEMVAALAETGDPSVISRFAEAPPEGNLRGLQALEADGSDWAQGALKAIRRNCPLSVACAFEGVRRAREMTRIEDALALEYRFVFRCMEDGEFLEGIRAAVIDKDRNPRWATPRLEDVTPEMVAAMLAPLGADELRLGGAG